MVDIDALKTVKKTKLMEPVIIKALEARNKAVNTLNSKHKKIINPEREKLKQNVIDAVQSLKDYMDKELSNLIIEANELPKVKEATRIIKSTGVDVGNGQSWYMPRANSSALNKFLEKYTIEESKSFSKIFKDLNQVLRSFN